MKPPVIQGPGGEGPGRGVPPPNPPYDPLPTLWTLGAIFAVAGVGVMLLDNPLVPLTHVFGLVPIGLGGAIGAAILRERYGPIALVGFGLVMLYLVWQTLANQTTGGLVLLTAGLFNLVRAVVRTVEWEP